MSAAGNISEVERLYLADRSRLGTTDAKGWTSLHHAAANDHSQVLIFLINAGAGKSQL